MANNSDNESKHEESRLENQGPVDSSNLDKHSTRPDIKRPDFLSDNKPEISSFKNMHMESQNSFQDRIMSLNPQGFATDFTAKPRKTHKFLLFLLFLFLIVLICITGGLWYFYPSTLWSSKTPPSVILYDTPLAESDFRFEESALLISYDFVKTNLDKSIYWEPAAKKIVVTTADKVIEMDTDQLTAFINSKPVSIDVPVVMYGNKPFIPLDFLAPVYGIVIERLPSGIVVIDDLKKPVLTMIVKNTTSGSLPVFKNFTNLYRTVFLRESPSFRSNRIKELMADDTLIVVGEENNWYKVRSNGGLLGYVNKSNVILKEILPIRQAKAVPHIPWKPIGGKINMTWDYMSTPKNDMSKNIPLAGLNVISPTWFSLEGGDGNIKNNGSLPYVEWAHKEGLQVWALFSNNFDPVITTKVLRSFETRKKVISQLLVLANSLNFDGVNIDFEDINYDDKDFFTQFIRELTPYMHEQDLTVSIDVTIRSTNPNWSMVYDRPEIGKIVDYMAVMTYDEHWSSSPTAGSVASIPWVESGMKGILEQVPKEKLLLGVPFYSRLWEEAKQEDGSVKVSSKALTMPVVIKLLKDKNIQTTLDQEAKQNFATYTETDKVYKIWIEDEFSMRQRIALVKSYDLAGVASWRKGFEEQAIWGVIESELTKMP